MNKIVKILILFTSFNSFLFSQDSLKAVQKKSKNSFYLEAGGSAIFYSLNYERTILTEGNFNFNTRIGMNYLDELVSVSVIGINVSYNKGKRNFCAAFDISPVLDYSTGNRRQWKMEEKYNLVHNSSYRPFIHVYWCSLSVSYRKYILKNLFCQASFYALFNPPDLYYIKSSDKIAPWGGVSLGYKF